MRCTGELCRANSPSLLSLALQFPPDSLGKAAQLAHTEDPADDQIDRKHDRPDPRDRDERGRPGVPGIGADRADDEHADDAGQRTGDVLLFDGSMSDEQTSQLIDAVSGVRGESTTQMWRWAAIILGALIALAGAAGAFLSGRRGREEKLPGEPETVVASRSSRRATRG